MIFEYYYFCTQFHFDYAFVRNEWNTNACCWKCAYVYLPIAKSFCLMKLIFVFSFWEFVMTLKCTRANFFMKFQIPHQEMKLKWKRGKQEKKYESNAKDGVQYKTFMSHDCFYHLQKCLFKSHPPTITICFAFFFSRTGVNFFIVHKLKFIKFNMKKKLQCELKMVCISLIWTV